MDAFYRGIETSLLVLSLVLGLGVIALSTPVARPAETAEIQLPMLSVTADPQPQ